MNFDTNFIVENILNSLEKDVNHCVPYFTQKDIERKT